jgi:hypothetical protein
MNMEAFSLFYVVYLTAVIWLGLLFVVGRKKRQLLPVQKGGLGVIACGSVFILVKGLPLWKLVFSFHPNPSLPLMGLVMIALWKKLTDWTIFRPEEWRAAWIFGAVAGSTLYLHSFVYGPVDLYFFGWDSEPVIVCMAGLGLIFLVNGNRFGILFIAALLAFGMDILESSNGWDYVIDPAYWLIGMGVTLRTGVAWLFRRSRARWRARRAPLESQPVKQGS